MDLLPPSATVVIWLLMFITIVYFVALCIRYRPVENSKLSHAKKSWRRPPYIGLYRFEWTILDFV